MEPKKTIVEESNTTKLFVGGVSHVANEESLRDYFGKYGQVISSEIVRNRITNVSRGFGFVVLCADDVVVGQVLREDHPILGKKVEVKVAIPKTCLDPLYNGQQKYIETGESPNSCQDTKIFVGGIPVDLTNDELKAYFDDYGTVTDTNVYPTRGFGFVTFDSNEGVQNSLKNSFHYLKNKCVEVKVAEARTESVHFCGLAQARLPYYYGNLIMPNLFGYSTYLPMCHCLSTRYRSQPPLAHFRKSLSVVARPHPMDEEEERDTKRNDNEAPRGR